jgi:UPF0755 protein
MKFTRILVFLFILIVLICGGFGFWLYKSLTTAQTHSKANQFIQIPKGSTPTETISRLTSEGIIANEYATLIYLRTFGDAGKLKAGEYQFDSPITPLQVLQVLEKGEERTIKLTIPEGWTRFEIAKRVAEKFPTTPPTDEATVMSLMDDTSLIKDFDPQAKNLEGYMFPTTYTFPIGTRPADVIKRLVEQFKKTWRNDWTDVASQMGKTPRDIVIIASMIETESKAEGERPVVASVIYNRLNKGIALGIDQSSIYAVKMARKWDGTINKSDVEIDSPYNTRKYPGLPPGPIASPGESAIQAALNPAQTNYIYYVLNVDKNDGSHNFYSSASDFERGKKAYQVWLEAQRQKKKSDEAGQ